MSSGFVQILGLQRSGTRWLAMLVQNNYAVDVSRTGKHSLPGEYPFKDPSARLVIRKRFDHWLGSVYRNHVNLPETRPEMFHCGKVDIGAALAVWRNFYVEWYAQDCVVQIEYERLLRDPGATLGAVAGYLGWGRQPGKETWQNGGPDKMPEWRKEMYIER